jgi:hypothetical protein
MLEHIGDFETMLIGAESERQSENQQASLTEPN